jgi:hypothetical protein
MPNDRNSGVLTFDTIQAAVDAITQEQVYYGIVPLQYAPVFSVTEEGKPIEVKPLLHLPKMTARQKAIYNELHQDWKELYAQSLVCQLPESQKSCVSWQVQYARFKFKVGNQDELARRLEKYGNKGGWGHRKIKEFDQKIFDDKIPTQDYLGKWISIEIECIMPDKNAESKFIQWARKEGIIPYVTFHDDGSLRAYKDDEINHEHTCNDDNDDTCYCCENECECTGGPAFAREIIVSCLWNNFTIIRKVCSKLNEIGCTVNHTCGLHVHFDCRHISKSMVETIGQRVANAVPALKLMLPKSRQKNEYCETTINDINTDESRHYTARYSFVNLMSYNRHCTLEIRGHSGTTDATKIINWICILRKIMRSPNNKQIKTISILINKFKFRKDLCTYITKRAKKFEKEVGRDETAADNEDAA